MGISGFRNGTFTKRKQTEKISKRNSSFCPVLRPCVQAETHKKSRLKGIFFIDSSVVFGYTERISR